jgi:hypothetical protein
MLARPNAKEQKLFLLLKGTVQQEFKGTFTASLGRSTSRQRPLLVFKFFRGSSDFKFIYKIFYAVNARIPLIDGVNQRF